MKYSNILQNLGTIDVADLPRYLAKIGKVFDINELLNQNFSSNEIVNYYETSALGYNLFHSKDSLHMALNSDGKFDSEGYYGQAAIIQEELQPLQPQNVLELASGKGFNSKYLAEHNPTDVQFIGVDLTPLHVETAQKRSTHIPNLTFELGDFHQLRFDNEQFDLVFIIESLCHATDMKLALSEIHRVLKPGGRLVVIDGFRKAPLETFDPDLQTAAILVEKAMAVPEGSVIDDWVALAQKTNYEIIDLKDIAQNIMPNLLRFHLLAKAFFKFPTTSTILRKSLRSHYLLTNAVAGLLLPYTVNQGVHGYFVASLGRK